MLASLTDKSLSNTIAKACVTMDQSTLTPLKLTEV